MVSTLSGSITSFGSAKLINHHLTSKGSARINDAQYNNYIIKDTSLNWNLNRKITSFLKGNIQQLAIPFHHITLSNTHFSLEGSLQSHSFSGTGTLNNTHILWKSTGHFQPNNYQEKIFTLDITPPHLNILKLSNPITLLFKNNTFNSLPFCLNNKKNKACLSADIDLHHLWNGKFDLSSHQLTSWSNLFQLPFILSGTEST